ncbi:hypothetical protein [Nocardioides daejeonensis]|uniref:hypothetical protein n=1 Tax=Nocardioides daejeonensis TaxID=1046556 RepID=UPI0013A596C3|nr:hypothetical protein [Nocardioides daejeonensis]
MPTLAPAPRRTRIVAVVAVLVAAPMTAELIQAYLETTGQLAEQVFFVLFLAPLYGGAALLIRELTVRTGRGWSARLLLAAAFGVLMTGVVDRSLFTPDVPEIDYYAEFVASASVGGVGLYALVSWAGGHVLMSIGAPLALVETLARRGQDRPWLGGFGASVLALLCVGVAIAINREPENPIEASWGHYAFVVGLAVALVALALSPLGRPVTRLANRRTPPPWAIALTSLALFSCLDQLPGWPGLLTQLAILGLAVLLVRRWSASPDWSWQHVGFLAWGALLSRTLLSFTFPTPAGVDPLTKDVQSAVFVLLALGVGVALARRRSRGSNVAEEGHNGTPAGHFPV